MRHDVEGRLKITREELRLHKEMHKRLLTWLKREAPELWQRALVETAMPDSGKDAKGASEMCQREPQTALEWEEAYHKIRGGRDTSAALAEGWEKNYNMAVEEIRKLRSDKAQLEYALAAVNKSAKASELQVGVLRDVLNKAQDHLIELAHDPEYKDIPHKFWEELEKALHPEIRITNEKTVEKPVTLSTCPSCKVSYDHKKGHVCGSFG